MKRSTLFLEQTLKEDLARAAKHLSLSESAVIRAALRKYLAELPQRAPRIKAVGESSDGGVASHVDDALDELGASSK